MNKRKAFNNKKGFTLVEMIVVIVILGILLQIMVPQLIKYIDNAKAVQCQGGCELYNEGISDRGFGKGSGKCGGSL